MKHKHGKFEAHHHTTMTFALKCSKCGNIIECKILLPMDVKSISKDKKPVGVG